MVTAESSAILVERVGTCVVCDAKGAIHYDARFDAEVCDVCDAMLTIRDDEFRRAHPEHDEAIRTIWRDRGSRDHATTIGLWYYESGYWDEQEQLDGYALPSTWSERANPRQRFASLKDADDY